MRPKPNSHIVEVYQHEILCTPNDPQYPAPYELDESTVDEIREAIEDNTTSATMPTMDFTDEAGNQYSATGIWAIVDWKDIAGRLYEIVVSRGLRLMSDDIADACERYEELIKLNQID